MKRVIKEIEEAKTTGTISTPINVPNTIQNEVIQLPCVHNHLTDGNILLNKIKQEVDQEVLQSTIEIKEEPLQ